MNDKPPRADRVATCSCCGTNLIDAVVEHVWFEFSTPWCFDFTELSRSIAGESEHPVDVEDMLALFVAVRVPVLTKLLAPRNRHRLLDMKYEKQLAVILELVARGLLA